MSARKRTNSWVRLLAVLLLLWMLVFPMAAVAGGEDDPGGMGTVEGAMPPADEEQSTDLVGWLLWLMTLQILP